MEYQLSRVASHSIVRGLISVLSANGTGIADAVRNHSGWLPAGVVAFGGVSAGVVGVIWTLGIWAMLSGACWLFFAITASPAPGRSRFIDVVNLCGWCMLPFSIAALILTVPTLIFTETLVLILVCIWMIIALGAGWSALTGMPRLRASVAALFGVGTAFMLQMMIWFVALLFGLYIFTSNS